MVFILEKRQNFVLALFLFIFIPDNNRLKTENTMSLSFGNISINTASDWVAADVLFRAELQSINAEISALTEDLERSQAVNDETRVSDIQSRLEELQTTRKSVIENLNEYCTQRRSKLS